MFNETAEKWFDKLSENKVYVFANGQVKMANKKFTSIKNDFCLTFGFETEIQEVNEDAGIQQNAFSFTRIDQIIDCPNMTTVDVIGVAMDIGQLASIKMKSGDSRDKLNIVIADESNRSIAVTVWGDLCMTAAGWQRGEIIAFKACRVSDYNGKTLNASSAPQDCVVNVQHARSAQLRKWYTSSDHMSLVSNLQSLSATQERTESRPDSWFSLAEMINEAESNTDIRYNQKSAWYKATGYCTFYVNTEEQKLMYYLACPQCKKKVSDEPSGYRCENCSKSFGEAIPTYNFGFKFSDYTQSINVQCLGEAGEAILGIQAVKVFEMDPDAVK